MLSAGLAEIVLTVYPELDKLGKIYRARADKCLSFEYNTEGRDAAHIFDEYFSASDMCESIKQFKLCMDTALKIRLIGMFCALWEEKKPTVLFVTHDAEEACMLAHRVLVLGKGGVLADIVAQGEVPRAYGAASAFKSAVLSALLAEE